MNIGKYAINLIAAFIAYFILYMAWGMFIVPDAFNSMQTAMIAEDDPGQMWILLYHFIQTIVVVWLFHKAVSSDDLKAGAMFGFMMGLYLAVTDGVWFTGLLEFPKEAMMPLMLANVVNGTVVGALLAFLHGKGMSMAAEG